MEGKSVADAGDFQSNPIQSASDIAGGDGQRSEGIGGEAPAHNPPSHPLSLPEAPAQSHGFGFGPIADDEGDKVGFGAAAPPPRADSDADDIGDWPILGAEAYHGIVGDIVNAIAPETEADPVGILLTLLAAVGNAIGNGPAYEMMDGKHHANIFGSLVGDTASGKGRAWSIVQRLMAKAAPDWSSQSIGYGLSSGEGLVDRLKDDGDEALTLPMQKRLLCVETEFSRPITAMRREGNTLSSILRSAWDGQRLEVLTRGKSRLLASNAHVSLIAHITPEELSKLLANSVEVANGFSNRFLWALVKRSRLLPHGGDPSILDRFVGPLADAIAHARGSAAGLRREVDPIV